MAFHCRQAEPLEISAALERYDVKLSTEDQYADIRRVIARRDADQRVMNARYEGYFASRSGDGDRVGAVVA